MVPNPLLRRIVGQKYVRGCHNYAVSRVIRGVGVHPRCMPTQSRGILRDPDIKPLFSLDPEEGYSDISSGSYKGIQSSCPGSSQRYFILWFFDDREGTPKPNLNPPPRIIYSVFWKLRGQGSGLIMQASKSFKLHLAGRVGSFGLGNNYYSVRLTRTYLAGRTNPRLF